MKLWMKQRKRLFDSVINTLCVRFRKKRFFFGSFLWLRRRLDLGMTGQEDRWVLSAQLAMTKSLLRRAFCMHLRNVSSTERKLTVLGVYWVGGAQRYDRIYQWAIHIYYRRDLFPMYLTLLYICVNFINILMQFEYCQSICRGYNGLCEREMPFPLAPFRALFPLTIGDNDRIKYILTSVATKE